MRQQHLPPYLHRHTHNFGDVDALVRRIRQAERDEARRRELRNTVLLAVAFTAGFALVVVGAALVTWWLP